MHGNAIDSFLYSTIKWGIRIEESNSNRNDQINVDEKCLPKTFWPEGIHNCLFDE
jgi:hypothetical protein